MNGNKNMSNIVSEEVAFELMTSLFDDLVVEGTDGALEAVQELIRRTQDCLADDNFVDALEQYLNRKGLLYIFEKARAGDQQGRDAMRTIRERTREILPEGRNVLDRYREYLVRCVAEARTSKSVRKGRKA